LARPERHLEAVLWMVYVRDAEKDAEKDVAPSMTSLTVSLTLSRYVPLLHLLYQTMST
jgi:hypothetical protein